MSMGGDLYCFKVRYESDPCEAFTLEGLTHQQNLIHTLGTSPMLLETEAGRFESLKMFHDGLKWVVELQRQETE